MRKKFDDSTVSTNAFFLCDDCNLDGRQDGAIKSLMVASWRTWRVYNALSKGFSMLLQAVQGSQNRRAYGLKLGKHGSICM